MDRRFVLVQASQIHVTPRALTSIDQVGGRSSTVVPHRAHEVQVGSSLMRAVSRVQGRAREGGRNQRPCLRP